MTVVLFPRPQPWPPRSSETDACSDENWNVYLDVSRAAIARAKAASSASLAELADRLTTIEDIIAGIKDAAAKKELASTRAELLARVELVKKQIEEL